MIRVARAGWGAAPASAVTRLPASKVDELVVHYSAALADQVADHADCPARVRGIQRYHQETKGWADIAYNWLFCQHGVAFEGRGWGVMSAATLGHNQHTQAICFLGADRDGRDDVTVPGRHAAAELVGDFLGWQGGTAAVVGHRDRVSTACPGDELYAWVNAEGWLSHDPAAKPWPLPMPAEFWAWARWRRRRWLYRSRLAWLAARPAAAPVRVPAWYWTRLAAMGGA